MHSVIVAFVIACSLTFGHGELKSAAILFRHGERTPVFTYPKYGETAILKELGYIQLTLVRRSTIYLDNKTITLSLLFPDWESSIVHKWSSVAQSLLGTSTSVWIFPL